MGLNCVVVEFSESRKSPPYFRGRKYFDRVLHRPRLPFSVGRSLAHDSDALLPPALPSLSNTQYLHRASNPEILFYQALSQTLLFSPYYLSLPEMSAKASPTQGSAQSTPTIRPSSASGPASDENVIAPALLLPSLVGHCFSKPVAKSQTWLRNFWIRGLQRRL
jgi:hypothetical protein